MRTAIGVFRPLKYQTSAKELLKGKPKLPLLDRVKDPNPPSSDMRERILNGQYFEDGR